MRNVLERIGLAARRVLEATTGARSQSRSSRPYVPQLTPVHTDALLVEIAKGLDLAPDWVVAAYGQYRELHEKRGYALEFGEEKTLNCEEAFVLLLLMKRFAPATIVEIGTQFGKSTRRLLDIKQSLKLTCPLVCFDVVDLVKFFRPEEATLHLKDVTHTFRKDVLDAYPPGLIYLDAHPFHLLENIIGEYLASPGEWMLAIHDCAPGLCNPVMEQDKADLDITSARGVWERHVLAAAFSIGDPLSSQLDCCSRAGMRLRILHTRHGLAVLGPESRFVGRQGVA